MLARHVSILCALIGLSVSSVACTGDTTSKALATGTIQIRGAGATFPAPLYKKWHEEYHKRQAGVVFTYDAVGSGEGAKQFLTEAVDYGASDAALNDEEMAKVARGAQLIPMTAGSIVLAYKLDGLNGELKLKRDVYVDIFRGKITTWNDPRIKATNPTLNLPNIDIALAVRQESSGTTFAFTNHLSAISEEWRDRGPGATRLLDWPGNAMAARGNEGVAGRTKVSNGAIGYVEYGFAERTGLAMAWLENKAGKFVKPYGGSGLATLMSTDMPPNLRMFLPDPEGDDSYPIVTYTWLMLYKKYDDPQKVAALKQYVTWCLTVGQEFSESLGFLRLPPKVVAQAVDALGQVQ